MKADMEAMKEQMATMMESIMSMKRVIEVNTATAIAASTTTKVCRNLPFGGKARRNVKMCLLMKKMCGVSTNVY